MTSKKELSERDICTKFIVPALKKAGWDMERQVREEVSFTDGRIYVRGTSAARGSRKRADFILYYKSNIPIAVIEAKDNNHNVGDGIQQALGYAVTLDIPVAFSSNGDGFVEHDRTATSGNVERDLELHEFPSPEDLWQRYKQYKGIETEQQESIASCDYFFDGKGRSPRYYQQIAINRTVEAIAKGQNRILLVMATGTGKTYTAFQIIHRLWKCGTKQRILFLADRNALIDQTKRGDFKHFKDRMTVIRKKKIDKAFEIYLALYQGLTNYDEDSDAYREFSPDFFDLIVVDECHRGSAAADSAWREILDYFKSATHIGMTATPKETKSVSNIEYFGEPIYTYSLRQGISDGFLAPYKVLRVGLNVDLEGWRPEEGQLDKDGNPVDDRLYNTKDYDRSLVIDERTRTVARKVTEFLRKTDPFDKTIVFCVDIEHATRIRQHWLETCNLHTIVRLPNSVFQPYASVATNLLFFTKGEPTQETWYWEHQLPEGVKAYSKTKPIQNSEFARLKDWWHNRQESEQAWRVSFDTMKANGYNLDNKNPHIKEVAHTYTSTELLELLHQSFQKSDELLKMLRKELAGE